MFERISEIEARYQELEDKLGQPELARDPGKLRELTQELAGLRELVTAYRTWKQLGTAVAENEELAGDADPEIREMAKAELAAMSARRDELEGELKKLLIPRDPLDQKSVVLEIRPGTGGEEPRSSRATCSACTRARQGWARREVLSLSEERGGIREVIASIGGKACRQLKYGAACPRARVRHRIERAHPHSTATGRGVPEADTADS